MKLIFYLIFSRKLEVSIPVKYFSSNFLHLTRCSVSVKLKFNQKVVVLSVPEKMTLDNRSRSNTQFFLMDFQGLQKTK